ncbi:MAG: sirohydrochlorin cobaltochelatase, partial [Sarcina sp.]
NIKEVKLVPLMVVAGDHAKNDMASDEEDSWKTMLEAEGIKVKIHLNGLGEEDSFNKLYINRINDVIKHRYIGVGDTKKR